MFNKLFMFLVLVGLWLAGAQARAAFECEGPLTHFNSFDWRIEKPLEMIFQHHAFELFTPHEAEISDHKLVRFYTLIENELLKAGKTSRQLSSWIMAHRLLIQKIRGGDIAATEPVRIVLHTLRALVVNAVALDLTPHIENRETEYKLAFAALIFSQRLPPNQWRVELKQISDPESQQFIAKTETMEYSVFRLLQKGPWTGRYEVIYNELSTLRSRAAERLRKYKINRQLEPFVEKTLNYPE